RMAGRRTAASNFRAKAHDVVRAGSSGPTRWSPMAGSICAIKICFFALTSKTVELASIRDSVCRLAHSRLRLLMMDRSAIFAAAFLLLLRPATQAGDWPQWRGPNRDGVADEKGLLK